jgi:hypothetical protein
MDIYAFNGDLDSLLLVDGDWVVNGGYSVQVKQDGLGTYIVVHPKYKAWPRGKCPHAYFVMKAPEVFNYDYNVILNHVRDLLSKDSHEAHRG